jgi:hypothetical protein
MEGLLGTLADLLGISWKPLGILLGLLGPLGASSGRLGASSGLEVLLEVFRKPSGPKGSPESTFLRESSVS